MHRKFKFLIYQKNIIFLILFLLIPRFYCSLIFAQETLDDALYAYQESDLEKAREITQKHLNHPLSLLVLHLCQIHDHKNQNIPAGISGLKKLYENESLEKKIWSEAALAYARIIQLFQNRKLYTEYDNIDVRSIYNKIIKIVPHSLNACLAVMYLAETYLESANKSSIKKGFNLVENFINSYKGPGKNKVILHFFLEQYYINLYRDYKKSFEHLKKAYRIGISNEIYEELTLFRIGRICEKELNNEAGAKTYYEKYLKLYPYSERTPIVKRYLKKLNQGR